MKHIHVVSLIVFSHYRMKTLERLRNGYIKFHHVRVGMEGWIILLDYWKLALTSKCNLRGVNNSVYQALCASKQELAFMIGYCESYNLSFFLKALLKRKN